MTNKDLQIAAQNSLSSASGSMRRIFVQDGYSHNISENSVGIPKSHNASQAGEA
jgi:hypothetical protein